MAALHWAVNEGDFGRIQTLVVDLKANINITSKNNETPLYIAIKNNNFKVCKFLLRSGAKLHYKTQDYLYTALHLAINEKKDNKIQKLLIVNNHSYGLFNNYSVLDILNKYGNTPLHLAIMTEQYDIADLLIRRGAQVKIKNHTDETPNLLIRNSLKGTGIKIRLFSIRRLSII